MLASMAAARAAAEAHGVTLAFEPEHDNVVRDARGRRAGCSTSCARRTLRIVLDAANLLVPERARPPGARSCARRSSCSAPTSCSPTPRTSAATARSSPPAAATLDYALYVELLEAAGYTGPLVLHGLAEAEVPDAVAFLRARLAE